ncbi:PorV/PorQ family protein [bacterium]|nr:PorV/PorQ family protein [bacterium]
MHTTTGFRLLLILLAAGRAFGQGFLSLDLGVDARSGALGMTSAALAGSHTAWFANPAVLASGGTGGGMLTHHRWIQGVTGTFLGFSGSAGVNGLGVGILYTDLGTMEHRLTPDPAPQGTFSASELAVSFSWARPLSASLQAGVTLKVLYNKIFIYETGGIAADAGVIWRPASGGPVVGLSVNNLGRTGKLDRERIDLPLSGSLGLSLPLALPGGRGLAAADAVYYRERGWYLHCGAEYSLDDLLFLRLGVRAGEGEYDPTAGIGMRVDRYQIDYAYMPLHAGLGESHKVTLCFAVGKDSQGSEK